jgi:hypothetical protein
MQVMEQRKNCHVRTRPIGDGIAHACFGKEPIEGPTIVDMRIGFIYIDINIC